VEPRLPALGQKCLIISSVLEEEKAYPRKVNAMHKIVFSKILDKA
jgi:hypothetical protein